MNRENKVGGGNLNGSIKCDRLHHMEQQFIKSTLIFSRIFKSRMEIMLYFSLKNNDFNGNDKKKTFWWINLDQSIVHSFLCYYVLCCFGLVGNVCTIKSVLVCDPGSSSPGSTTLVDENNSVFMANHRPLCKTRFRKLTSPLR